MDHITNDEIHAFLYGNKNSANLEKAVKHLDQCSECMTQLKDQTLINILFENTRSIQRKKKYQSELLKCNSTVYILGLIDNTLSAEEKEVLEKHCNECKCCREEYDALRNSESVSETIEQDTNRSERYVPDIIRYREIYNLATMKKGTIEKEVKPVSIVDKIRSLLLPSRLVMVPLGFADLSKRDPRIYRELDDAQLMEACKNNDSMAWEELHNRFKGIVQRLCNRFKLYDDWEDIWQETLLVLAFKVTDYSEQGKAKYFILKIVYNNCLLRINKKKKEIKLFVDIDEEILEKPGEFDPQEILLEKESMQRILSNIQKMNEEHSTILKVMIVGLSDKEIAIAFKMDLPTVYKRKYTARRKLIDMKLEEPDFMEKIKKMHKSEKYLKSLLNS